MTAISSVKKKVNSCGARATKSTWAWRAECTLLEQTPRTAKTRKGGGGGEREDEKYINPHSTPLTTIVCVCLNPKEPKGKRAGKQRRRYPQSSHLSGSLHYNHPHKTTTQRKRERSNLGAPDGGGGVALLALRGRRGGGRATGARLPPQRPRPRLAQDGGSRSALPSRPLSRRHLFFQLSVPLRLARALLNEFASLGAAARRNEAAGWLRRTVGAVAGRDLPEEPSEEEFRLGLRNGQILCSALNRVHPGAVQKAKRSLCSSV